MAYKFKHSLTVPENVKRIAGEEIDSAMQCLRRKDGPGPDESVHEVRKSIKKTRALLRLVRPELGPFYKEENVRLRDAGRQLSELRDAGALIGALDELRKHQKNGALQSMQEVRNRLAEHKRHLEGEAKTHKLMPSVASDLQKARKTIRYWPLGSTGFSAIRSGLEKTFRDGRKALAQARRSGRREDFHEWRKRVKDHWYQVRLLQKSWHGVLDGYERSLKELEDLLGEDLNLAVLTERVQTMASENGNRLKAEKLLRAIESSRKELREHALEIGQRVYAEKPQEFARQVKRLWKAW